MLSKFPWRIALGLALVGVFSAHALGWLSLPVLPRLEAMLYDARVRLVAPQTHDDRVVIIDIDEKSLREKSQGGEGRWPWRRDRLAQLFTDLFGKYGVALIATDIILSEQDTSSGLDVLDRLAREELRNLPEFAVRLEQLRPTLSPDRQLAEAMKAGPVVLGYAFHNGQPAVGTELPPGLSPAAWGLSKLAAQSYPGYSGLLPELKARAISAGHLNPLRDGDGVTRRVPLLVEHQGLYYPALSLAVLQATIEEPVLGVASARYGASGQRVERLEAGPLQIPVDPALNALVPFRGSKGSFTYLSAVDVLQGKVDPQLLKGRIALIGTSAAGLSDLVATPVDVSLPGVEIHANLITGMLDERLLRAPAWVSSADLLAVLVLGGLMMWAGIRLRALQTMLVFVVATSALVGINIWLLAREGLVVPLASPLACLTLVFILDLGWGFFVESRSKRQMSALFGYYVPPEIVEKMALDPAAFSMVPTERQMTVLFADIRNFTTLSEGLSPSELGEVINTYLTAMSEVIRTDHHGTLDKYIGDAVMAFWGAPVAAPAHALDAVLAARDMQRAMEKLEPTMRARGWPELRIGVGVNTGTMRVGDMGSRIRRAYTVMGDAVNLASRLEGLTKVYGTGILIGEGTRQSLAGWVCREVDRVKVKGKLQPVVIYEPIGPEVEVTPLQRDELAQWQAVLDAYHARQWAVAAERVRHLARERPEFRLYAVYRDRLQAFEQQPPPADWDGSTQA
jgi:adenylate cyclase